MILRTLRPLPLKGMAVFLLVVIMLQNVNSKPQDPAVFENIASQAVEIADSVVSVAKFSKNVDFEVPFAKVKSESKAGTGAALRNDDDDSSEEDRRRKRSIDFQIEENSLKGEEFHLAVPLQHHHHFHRGRRSPCHTGAGGTGGGIGGGIGGSIGGGGTAGGGVPADGIEIAFERRLQTYARKRKAAAKNTRRNKNSTNSRKKKLITDHSVTRRRKRQSELDDLNPTTQNEANDFAKYAQQVAENLRKTFENIVASMTDMAEKLKQHFSPQNATDTMEI